MRLFCAVVGKAGGVFDVNIDASALVSALKEAIKKKKPNDLKYVDADTLQLFLAKKNNTWLKDDKALDEVLQRGDVTPYEEIRGSWKLNDPELFGSEVLPEVKVVHVLVKIPPQVPPQGALGQSLAPAVQMPEFTPLDNWDEYLAECLLDQWKAGEVRDIPLISQFMESLGGCSRKKNIFWREEEKQVSSILLYRWFHEPSSASIVSYADMKSILVGSPGIGKSTLAIIMAFYVVLKRRKNVLVYRQLTYANQGSCLFYLGYEDGRVVSFAVQRCHPQLAINIYEALGNHQGFSNVWLWLDRFAYEDIPAELRTFKMLTSLRVDLKSSESEYAYRCLLPSWKKQDIFKLGREVFKFEAQDMENRFCFSGGSCWDFILEKEEHLEDLRMEFLTRIQLSEDLYRTFVTDTKIADHYLLSTEWEQIIDSEYAVLLLSRQIRSKELLRSLHWAQRAGYDTLAGTIFGICFHRLALDNDLILHVAEYGQRKLKDERQVDSIRLEMKEGGAFCSDTAAWLGYDEDELKKWRDDNTLSYWYPYGDDFPNIDGIVKLKPASPDQKSRVAFLHLTVGHQHRVDDQQLGMLHGIFTTKVSIRRSTLF